MSEITKCLLQAASGFASSGGGSYRPDEDDPNTELWVLKLSWFPNAAAIMANGISAANAGSIYFSALDSANDLHIYNYSSDGAIASNKIEITGMTNSAGAVVDPYDTDYVYASGVYVDGTYDQIQICKLNSDLATTTPVWNYRTNFTASVGDSGGAPVITKNYLWQPVNASTSATDGTDGSDRYLAKMTRDGSVVDVIKIDLNQAGQTLTGSTFFDITQDESLIYFVARTNTGTLHLCCFNLSNNTLAWSKKMSGADSRSVSVDNSDNGVIINYYIGDYGYIEKFNSSGVSQWGKRFGTSSIKILQILTSVKQDGSEGVFACQNNKTDDFQYFVGTFDPSDGTLSSNCNQFAGSNNRNQVVSVCPLIIGDRVYTAGYIYNISASPTFEGFFLKSDTSFSDSISNFSFFATTNSITSKATVSTLSASSTSLTWTVSSGETASLLADTSLFLQTAGPSNVGVSSLTPAKYQWRS